jgi:uncharacterized membrane protein YjjP (DUF1212 family)
MQCFCGATREEFMKEELQRKPLPQEEKEYPFWAVTLGVIVFCAGAWWFIGGEVLRFIGPYLQGGHYGP